jgi:hypothetical protein
VPTAKPTYSLSRWIFLRGLALVFLIAFLSLRAQIEGLIGSRGILPVAEFMERVRRFSSGVGFLELPTLCWWSASDAFLHLQCAAGVVLSLALFVGFAPRACLFLLWALYLSLATAGQDFLSFQWDVLLLETAVFAIPFAPGTWIPRWKGAIEREKPPSPAALFLVRWILFRLMIASAWTKLAYDDATWLDGTAMTFHYWTQPLPTWFGWWAHQLPEWFQRASCLVMYVIELGLPLFLFGPRVLRLAAFAGLVFLQILIALTGNYGFFNLLTVVLCLPLLDDAILARWLPLGAPREPQPSGTVGRVVPMALAALVVLQTTCTLLVNVRHLDQPPGWVAAVDRAIGPFRSLNDYGLFRVMTKERREIEIQGSDDGVEWKPYVFRWKPGDLDSAPAWVQPHMPRLDWQMWFAALGPPHRSRWFEPLLVRLLEGSPAVVGLFSESPFPDRPPRFVRALIHDYRFTTPSERSGGAGYWSRELLGIFAPPRSLR